MAHDFMSIILGICIGAGAGLYVLVKWYIEDSDHDRND